MMARCDAMVVGASSAVGLLQTVQARYPEYRDPAVGVDTFPVFDYVYRHI